MVLVLLLFSAQKDKMTEIRRSFIVFPTHLIDIMISIIVSKSQMQPLNRKHKNVKKSLHLKFCQELIQLM